MTDLKKNLDEYLLLKSDTKKSFSLKFPTVPSLDLSKWKNNEEIPNNTWFEEAKHECCPSMTRLQRITGFIICLLMGFLCFGLSCLYIPVLLLKARKFSLLYTLGSLFFVFSFSFLWGPLTYVKYMFSRGRICLTLLYLTTLFATLYCALHLQSTPLTVLCAIGQVVTILWIALSGVPGGSSGIKFFSYMFSKTVSTTLPV